jgi:hypothetical protein
MRNPISFKLAALTFAQAVLLAASSSAFADNVQQLLRGTTDAMPGTLDVQILTNDDVVATGFQAVTDSKTQAIGLTDLPQGIVLFNFQGFDVATLKSPDFDPQHGGTLQFTYLRNALSNTYGTLTVDLVRDGDKWELVADDQSGHHVVTRGYFKAKKVFGQVVGIDSITLQP